MGTGLTMASLANAFSPIKLRPDFAPRRIAIGGGITAAVSLDGRQVVSYDLKTRALVTEFYLPDYADLIQISQDGSFAVTRDWLNKDTPGALTQISLWRLRAP